MVWIIPWLLHGIIPSEFAWYNPVFFLRVWIQEVIIFIVIINVVLLLLSLFILIGSINELYFSLANNLTMGSTAISVVDPIHSIISSK